MTPAPAPFDFKNPDYVAVFKERLRRLAWIRADDPMDPTTGLRFGFDLDGNPTGGQGWTSAEKVANLRAYYKTHIPQFIDDWGMTFDPRNPERGLPSVIPMRLFPKQFEFCDWVLERWRGQDAGLGEKSRDMGLSWLAVSLGASLALFYSGVTIGYGSRVEDLVDQIGNPDSLFWKARFFVENLPPEFNYGWNAKQNSAHMRLSFPVTGSAMTGDAGDDIGRGGRSSIYFVDESAALPRPMLVEASLSQTTNCRIDISTPKGLGNPFAQKRHSGKYPVFTFHWRDDPRKDDAWYAKQVEKLDPVTLAQEVDLNYSASAVGIVIPSAWVQAAIDADKVLGLEITGDRRGALDVADEGVDLNAFARRWGFVVEDVEAWSGKGADIFGTVQHAFALCDTHGLRAFDYDADGLGAGVRGDARVINEGRKEGGAPIVDVQPFRGSGGVFKPDEPIPTITSGVGRDRSERLNKDFFANAKAQAWWALRLRFQRTYRAVVEKSTDYAADDLISLRGDMPALAKLTMELSQPTYTINTVGKMVIDKAPDGTRSPNHADAVMILFAPRKIGSWLDAYAKRAAAAG